MGRLDDQSMSRVDQALEISFGLSGGNDPPGYISSPVEKAGETMRFPRLLTYKPAACPSY